jgi:hypothetical protein
MTTLLTGLHGPSGRLLLVRFLDAGHVTGSATQGDPVAGSPQRMTAFRQSMPNGQASSRRATCSRNQGTDGWIMAPEVLQVAVRCAAALP